MKKLSIFIFIFLITSFISCSNIEYSRNITKPNDSYYTENIKTLKNDEIKQIKLIENKFYKEVILDKNSSKLIIDMINALDKSNSTQALDDNIECLFKLHIENNSNKYVVDVYGNDIISIYPWDGIYEKDFLDISELPLSLKAESICNFILKN